MTYTRETLLALGESPQDIDRVLARQNENDDDAVPPEGAMRVPVSRDEE